MKQFFALLLIAAGLSGCSAQTLPVNLQTGIDSIFKDYAKPDGPGVAVLIVKDGKVVFEKGYGMANLEYNMPITPTSVFDIASVSKQFTGYAISTLIQQGKISPDDDIHKYLPDVPDFGKKITIHNLIHHTSGLRDWPEGLHAAGWRWDESFTYEDIMRMVHKQHDLDFDPGSQYQYSNTGYNLLAAIVAKVSGKTFPQWVAENIFKPLGMQATMVLDDYSKVIPHLASSYYQNGNEYHKATDQLTAFGSSSIFTTVEDLGKWVIRFQQGLADKDPVYLRMIQTDTLNNGKPNSYAYGLLVDNQIGAREISHDGGWAAYATNISNFPDEKVGIILLSNSGNFNADGESDAVARLVLKLKAGSGEKREDLSKLSTVKVDTNLLKKYTGTYQLGPGWFVTFTLENGLMMTQATGEDKFPTDLKSDTTLWVPAYNSSVKFVQVTDKANAIIYHRKVSKRVTPIAVDATQLGQFVGSYYSRELEATYKITLEKGKLVAHHMRLGDFNLSQDMIAADVFGSAAGGSMAFYRDGQNKITGFKLSGGRIRNIVFEKQ
jgi:CubicO group peptidase (beta-lactamase class C family)